MKFKKYMKKYGIRFGIILIIVLIISIAAASAFNGNAGFIKNSVNEIGQPVEKASFSMTQWLENLYGYLFKYDNLVEENNNLRARIADLQAEARDYDEVNAENIRLRELLNLRDKHADFVYESAKIVSWDASNYTSSFTISKGSKHEIEVGDPVVTEYGVLVGEITEVGTSWATVRTVIDVGMEVGVLIGSAGSSGILDGEYSLMKNGSARIAYYASGAQAFIGDEVLTSGSGGAFPGGLIVGTVTDVMSQAGGQSTYSIVKPSCDFDTLYQVFVIKSFDIEE